MFLVRLAACLGVLLFVPAPTAAAQAPQPVSERYAAPGPWAVERTVVPGLAPTSSCPFAGSGIPTDSPDPGVALEIFSPDLEEVGAAALPLITFGNGSCATSREYESLLKHFASWGFVVVIANSDGTGDGLDILGAVDYLLEQNSNPDSIFHRRIDTGHIAAVGHSQGAGGAVNATVHSAGRITSTVAMNLPDPWWVNGPNHAFDLSGLNSAVFLVTGSEDPLSTAEQQSIYFDALPGPAARGRLLGTGHTWPDDGGGFRGYVTAWLAHTLRADADAAPAFTGSAPQLLSDSGWDRQELVGRGTS